MEEALEHPYLTSLHDVNDEPCAERAFEFDFETETLIDRSAGTMVGRQTTLRTTAQGDTKNV